MFATTMAVAVSTETDFTGREDPVFKFVVVEASLP
jgi:hypothetical protein